MYSAQLRQAAELVARYEQRMSSFRSGADKANKLLIIDAIGMTQSRGLNYGTKG